MTARPVRPAQAWVSPLVDGGHGHARLLEPVLAPSTVPMLTLLPCVGNGASVPNFMAGSTPKKLSLKTLASGASRTSAPVTPCRPSPLAAASNARTVSRPCAMPITQGVVKPACSLCRCAACRRRRKRRCRVVRRHRQSVDPKLPSIWFRSPIALPDAGKLLYKPLRGSNVRLAQRLQCAARLPPRRCCSAPAAPAHPAQHPVDLLRQVSGLGLGGTVRRSPGSSGCPWRTACVPLWMST